MSAPASGWLPIIVSLCVPPVGIFYIITLGKFGFKRKNPRIAQGVLTDNCGKKRTDRHCIGWLQAEKYSHGKRD